MNADNDNAELKLTREQADLLALSFVRDRGGDQIGIIDDDAKFAAALLYNELVKEGYLHSSHKPGDPLTNEGPCFKITFKGRQRLKSAGL